MRVELMIHNANQIALYFATFPHEEAIEGVTDHIIDQIFAPLADDEAWTPH